ncbi:hypothetical protein DBR17_02405 [Sphingomonas sp. HMWF008]|nr:hypothetical protein DBR17_02405 [Sphingomonas sp. HMWF008]
MNPSTREASEALTAMRESQARLAAAADCPPQRHLAFGALAGGLIATPVLPVQYWVFAELVILLAVPLIIRWDRRRTGMFINGYRRGSTRPLTFVMVAVLLALYGISVWTSQKLGIPWAPIVLGVAATGVGYAFSVQWQRRFRREMGVAA